MPASYPPRSGCFSSITPSPSGSGSRCSSARSAVSPSSAKRKTADAWTHIRSSQADVVIVDLRLADGSGLELIGTLSKAAPRVVTIVLTNHSAPAFREACALAGADYFFDKTVEFDAMVIESLAHARVHHP